MYSLREGEPTRLKKSCTWCFCGPRQLQINEILFIIVINIIIIIIFYDTCELSCRILQVTAVEVDVDYYFSSEAYLEVNIF